MAASQVWSACADKTNAYADVCSYADRLFSRIRQVVACQATPSTLKSAFLQPLRNELATAINLDMFARSDEDFMAMFNGVF